MFFYSWLTGEFQVSKEDPSNNMGQLFNIQWEREKKKKKHSQSIHFQVSFNSK